MNKRIEDLGIALKRGEHRNKNHYIRTVEGVIPSNSLCQHCPDNMRCVLIGKEVDVDYAKRQDYRCVGARYVFFSYHDSVCLVFDQVRRQLNDFGYWGFSVTTSRSIRWYIEALEHHNFITPIEGTAAVLFFRKRAHDTAPGVPFDKNAPEWHRC